MGSLTSGILQGRQAVLRVLARKWQGYDPRVGFLSHELGRNYIFILINSNENLGFPSIMIAVTSHRSIRGTFNCHQQKSQIFSFLRTPQNTVCISPFQNQGSCSTPVLDTI